MEGLGLGPVALEENTKFLQRQWACGSAVEAWRRRWMVVGAARGRWEAAVLDQGLAPGWHSHSKCGGLGSGAEGLEDTWLVCSLRAVAGHQTTQTSCFSAHPESSADDLQGSWAEGYRTPSPPRRQRRHLPRPSSHLFLLLPPRLPPREVLVVQHLDLGLQQVQTPDCILD